MGIIHETAASIGFHGDELDPAEITKSLGAEPTVGVKKGGRWLTGNGVEKVASRGMWRVKAGRCKPGNLDAQINGLLDGLTNDISAWRYFSERFRGRAFCGLFLVSGNEGLTLRPETLGRLAERGLLIDLDIYSADQPA